MSARPPSGSGRARPPVEDVTEVGLPLDTERETHVALDAVQVANSWRCATRSHVERPRWSGGLVGRARVALTRVADVRGAPSPGPTARGPATRSHVEREARRGGFLGRALVALSCAAAACGAPSPAPTTPGADLPETPCGRGLVVVNSDYLSTTVSLADPEGRVVSERLLTSGSDLPGMSAALSGDVWLPSARTLSGEIVLIDRYATSVLTFVEPRTATVRAQLPVGTGFKANPYDYLELDPHKAYVTRYESNPLPSAQPFDRGGDILVVDPIVPQIVGSISLGAPTDVPPRPGRMARLGGEVWVALDRLATDFQSAADGRLVGVDPATDTVVWTVDFPGLASCGAVHAAPSGKRAVVSCTGLFVDGDKQGDRAGLVVLEASPGGGAPVAVAIHTIPTELGGTPSWALAFRTETEVWTTTFGNLDANRPDRLVSIDLVTGEARLVHTGAAAFTLGDVRCSPACGALCFVADAGTRALLRFGGGAVTSLPVDRTTGLPPRYLGVF